MKPKKSWLMAVGVGGLLLSSVAQANSVLAAGYVGEENTAFDFGNTHSVTGFQANVESAEYTYAAFEAAYSPTLFSEIVTPGDDVYAYIVTVNAEYGTTIGDGIKLYSVGLGGAGDIDEVGYIQNPSNLPGAPSSGSSIGTVLNPITTATFDFGLGNAVGLKAGQHSDVLFFAVNPNYSPTQYFGNLADGVTVSQNVFTAYDAGNPNLVPLPASAGLGFSMLGGFGLLASLRKRLTGKNRIA